MTWLVVPLTFRDEALQEPVLTTVVLHMTPQQFVHILCWPTFLASRGSIVVKALCYKPEGRGFETR
jgi:hypothetical protein